MQARAVLHRTAHVARAGHPSRAGRAAVALGFGCAPQPRLLATMYTQSKPLPKPRPHLPMCSSLSKKTSGHVVWLEQRLDTPAGGSAAAAEPFHASRLPRAQGCIRQQRVEGAAGRWLPEVVGEILAEPTANPESGNPTATAFGSHLNHHQPPTLGRCCSAPRRSVWMCAARALTLRPHFGAAALPASRLR